MERIKFDFDFDKFREIQKINIKAFEISPVAIKNISSLHIPHCGIKTFETQKNIQVMINALENFSNNLSQLSYKNTTAALQNLSNMSKCCRNLRTNDITNLIKGIQDIYNTQKWFIISESLKTWSKQLQFIVNRIPDEDYELLLKNNEYTKQDIVEDIENVLEEVEEKDNIFQQIASDNMLNPKEKISKVAEEIYNRFPAVCYFVLVIGVLYNIHAAKEVLQNTYFPFFESIGIVMEGNQDKYIVKEEKVKVYELPNCRSKVVDTVYYGDELKEVKDVKMWLEVSYINDLGMKCTGWIAKRNLMTYKDWKYNSDDLYNIK